MCPAWPRACRRVSASSCEALPSDPEVVAKPTHRQFTVEYKLSTLEETDCRSESGEAAGSSVMSATEDIGLGVPEHVADAVLVHKETTPGFERYTVDRDSYLLHEERDALPKWGVSTLDAVDTAE